MINVNNESLNRFLDILNFEDVLDKFFFNYSLPFHSEESSKILCTKYIFEMKKGRKLKSKHYFSVSGSPIYLFDIYHSENIFLFFKFYLQPQSVEMSKNQILKIIDAATPTSNQPHHLLLKNFIDLNNEKVFNMINKMGNKISKINKKLKNKIEHKKIMLEKRIQLLHLAKYLHLKYFYNFKEISKLLKIPYHQVGSFIKNNNQESNLKNKFEKYLNKINNDQKDNESFMNFLGRKKVLEIL